MSVVQLSGASYEYPGGSRLAIDSITASFGPGTVTLVTGALGAGASTLLLVASGLAPRVTQGRRTGRVSVLGRDPCLEEDRRALGGSIALLLPTPWTQLSGVAPTVADEIAFGPANHGWPRSQINEAVQRVMDRVGVAHLAARDPVTLSGGELQRVILAALMAMEPEVFLLDEPALELDPGAARDLYLLLGELARTATVIIASTDVDRVAEFAGRVLLLQEGRCLADGTPEEVLGSEAAAAAQCTTAVAEISRRAGLAAPFPLTVAAATSRFSP